MYPEIPSLGKKEKKEEIEIRFPKQHQDKQPCSESSATPLPIFDNKEGETGNTGI